MSTKSRLLLRASCRAPGNPLSITDGGDSPSSRLTLSSVSEARGTETAADVPRPVPLRRNEGFRMLWIGQLLSGTGSQIGWLAYPLLILALTHSAVLAGAAGTARAVILIALQLPAGALSDRLDRRLTTSCAPSCWPFWAP